MRMSSDSGAQEEMWVKLKRGRGWRRIIMQLQGRTCSFPTVPKRFSCKPVLPLGIVQSHVMGSLGLLMHQPGFRCALAVRKARNQLKPDLHAA